MNDAPSFGDYLEATRWMFPSAMLGGDGLDRLIAAASRLPLCAIEHRFGFEFPLAGPSAGGDFAVAVGPDSDLAAHLIREGEAASAGSPAAALAACLSRAAGDPSSFLGSRRGGVILEYDVASAASGKPEPPGVFFVPHDNSVAAARALFDDPASTLAELRAVAGWRADAAERGEVERVHACLSGDALVAQAGVLPGRDGRAVRLVVHRVAAAGLPGLLGRLGWPGSVEAAMAVIERTADLTLPSAALSLDVAAGGVSPRLGIELYIPAEKLSMDRASWSPLIDRLADGAWCDPARAAGLKEWTRAETVIALGGMYRVFQHVNHVKAVVLDGRVSAKAYTAVVVGRVGG